MQYFNLFKRSITPSNIAFLVLITTFGLKHFLSITSAFQGIDLLWIDKILKSLGIIFLQFYFIKELLTKKISYKSPLFYMFIVYVVVFAAKLINYYFNDAFIIEYFKQNLNVLFGTISFFLIGFYFPKSLTKKHLKILVLTILFLFLYDLQFVSFKNHGLNLSLVKDVTQRGNYLFWGDSFAMLSLLAIFSLEGIKRYALILISSLGLAFLLSRSSLLAFSVALAVSLIVLKDYKILGLMFILTLIGGSIVLTGSAKLRALNITDLSDNSLNVRVEIMLQGIEAIKENFITGDFLGQLKNQGDNYNTIGHYIHNYLSVWRQFGLLSFFVFVFYYFQAAKEYVVRRPSGPYIGLVVYCLVSATFFKAYLFPYYWIIAGLVFSSFLLEKTASKVS